MSNDIPRTEGFDETRAFLSEGYRFVSNRCDRYGTDLFETRLALRKVVCMRGPEAAEMFYGGDRFTRRKAMPPSAVRLLQDRGSVQLLDGEAHRHRKGMFLALLDPRRSRSLADVLESVWRHTLPRWEGMDRVVLHDEVRRVLCRAVCAWAGVTLDDDGVEARTREFGAMIDGAGSAGPRNWWGQLLRARSERWARRLVDGVRQGRVRAPEGSALEAIATFRDADGGRLSTEAAAVELINILRPTVAVARFVTFAALALHEHPRARPDVGVDDGAVRRFVQEVRRFYPFFPVVGGRVREPFEWGGHSFEADDWVLLDLYGTNHDRRAWADPDRFDPDRFRDRVVSPWELIPQGAGEHARDHRCPGEWATIDLTGMAVRLLCEAMEYEVPEQDLQIDLSSMPALPASGLVLRNVRAVR